MYMFRRPNHCIIFIHFYIIRSASYPSQWRYTISDKVKKITLTYDSFWTGGLRLFSTLRQGCAPPAHKGLCVAYVRDVTEEGTSLDSLVNREIVKESVSRGIWNDAAWKENPMKTKIDML